MQLNRAQGPKPHALDMDPMELDPYPRQVVLGANLTIKENSSAKLSVQSLGFLNHGNLIGTTWTY